MTKGKTVVDSVEYLIQAWGKISNERYKFGVQAIPRKGRPCSFAGYVSEEFIEDEIDNTKNSNYLEEVTFRVVENHIGEMLKLSHHAVIGNLKYWFREAKHQLDKENKNE